MLELDQKCAVEARLVILHGDRRGQLDQLLVQKWRRASSHTASVMLAGIWLMPSATANAACSAGLNRSLSQKCSTAVILASEAPAALLPTALVSIQNGQPTIWAARRQTSERTSAGSVPLRRSGPQRLTRLEDRRAVGLDAGRDERLTEDSCGAFEPARGLWVRPHSESMVEVVPSCGAPVSHSLPGSVWLEHEGTRARN